MSGSMGKVIVTAVVMGLIGGAAAIAAEEVKTLEIGAKAPEFKLRGVDGKMHKLADYKKAEVIRYADSDSVNCLRIWEKLSPTWPEHEREISRLNRETAFDTANLEFRRERWNSRCSGEIRRYLEEHQWRRRSLGPILTLRRESVGSKQD